MQIFRPCTRSAEEDESRRFTRWYGGLDKSEISRDCRRPTTYDALSMGRSAEAQRSSKDHGSRDGEGSLASSLERPKAPSKFSANLARGSLFSYHHIRYHFLRDHLENGKFNIEYIPSENQVADILTKPLAAMKHQRFVRAMRRDLSFQRVYHQTGESRRTCTKVVIKRFFLIYLSVFLILAFYAHLLQLDIFISKVGMLEYDECEELPHSENPGSGLLPNAEYHM
jgi:hypothetical protein